jgi:predicted Na+-dependent transporter
MSKTAQNPLFFRQSGMNMPVLVYLAFSFVFLAILAYGLAKMLKFSHPNLVSVIFTAPQKTLALGVPLLSTYFANDPALKAVAILPILFYHPWQLFMSGIIKDLPFLKKKAS